MLQNIDTNKFTLDGAREGRRKETQLWLSDREDDLGEGALKEESQ